MVLGAGLGPAISKLSVWCLTNLATPTYNKAQILSYKEAGIQPAIFPWKGNVLALDYSSKVKFCCESL